MVIVRWLHRLDGNWLGRVTWHLEHIFGFDIRVGWISIGFSRVVCFIFLVRVLGVSTKCRVLRCGIDTVQAVACDLKSELIRGCLDKTSVKH
jgi:hypothetical protein